MLTAEAAAKRLEPHLFNAPDQEFESLPLVKAIAKLPAELRTIAFALLDRDEKGKTYPPNDWQNVHRRKTEALRPFETISAAKRRKLFTAIGGRLADGMEAAWELLKTGPYQSGYMRRAFRSPQRPETMFRNRKEWLAELATQFSLIDPDVLTPQWLAAWCDYLPKSRRDSGGQLLACVINRRDKTGDEVFKILCQAVKNEHEIAGISRTAVRALLMVDRPEGWDLIERTLLVAQRQEGLRQVILETVDEAHPQAFRRMLQVIRDEKLARFSAVTRAIDVWCGLNYESDQVKAINAAIDRAIKYLDDPAARKKAIASDDPEEAYFALWATGYEDVYAAVEQSETLQKHKSPEMRFVAAHFLSQVYLPESKAALTSMLDDEDLRVAVTALQNCAHYGYGEDSPENMPLQRRMFEQLEKLFERLPEKPKMLPTIVWPWTERKADRKEAARGLVNWVGDLPPTRLLPYLPAVDRYQRAKVVGMLAKQKKWDKLTRETLLELTGSPSADIRSVALDALTRVELTHDEILFIEGLLSRKVSDLRIGALKLLLKQNDRDALASADRLLTAKDALSRLAGLELLRQLMEADRERKECSQRARAYADATAKRTKDEQTQLDVLLSAPTEQLTLDNALGLMNPADLTPVPKVTAKKVEFVTDATIEMLKSLDELIHTHREERVRYTGRDGTEIEELLGAIPYLPHASWNQPIEQERSKLPLPELWENWFKNRPAKLRDPDGMEIIRAERFLKTVGGYSWNYVRTWAAKHPDRQTWIDALSNRKQPIKMKYERLVGTLIDWMVLLHHPPGAEDFLLDAVETYMALVPESCHNDLIELATSGQKTSHHFGHEDQIDWRSQYGTHEWHQAIYNGLLYRKETPEQFARRWRLACFRDRPVPGAARHRPHLQMALGAYRAGLANLADMTDILLGSRATQSSGQSFRDLNAMSNRNQRKEFLSFLAEIPKVADLVDRIRERILEIELSRGDTPTPATDPALALNYYGVATLGRILKVIGGAGFKVTNQYAINAKRARLPTLTDMVKSTYPLDTDTQAEFNRELKQCVKAGLKEQTILEMMFLAPQWTTFVEGYFNWPGLSEGLYWFLAHMKYINADAESAATAGGYEADKEEDGKDNRQNRSAWDRLIAERTPLTEEERANGAIDVDWFHRVYAQLTPKRWEMLAAAARFAATPAQAKRANFLGEVLLGKANRKELFAQVTQKKLKESVRLIGLYPLAKGAKYDSDLTQRYKMLVDYRRYAKGLSGLTKPSAMQALDIGFRNLASTAGYTDPLRLEWAMEADAVKDLAKGAVSAAKDGVTVTLALDELARPVVTTLKQDKPLKSVPPAIKKDKKVAELLDRIADIRRQASRVKESLEAAMCRGDAFEAEELVHLCAHALLRPLLSRLVLIADDRAGYPDKGGKSLRDYAGKQQAVKKNSTLRLAHPVDLMQRGDWSKWQHDCFAAQRVQPFKQIFRELYVVTKQEQKDGTRSSRYAGQQVNPQQANALWNARNWHTQDDVFKAFPAEGVTASVGFKYGAGTPLDVEGLTFDVVTFHRRDEFKPLKLADVPPRIFSEVMRDLDLVVSVAHRGGVDPEATASTVEMREVLVRETCELLGLKNVKIKPPRVIVNGRLAEYAVHLGSGNVHRMPGGALCVIPVHAQHRGRLFLPFADDDPRTAEIVSKVLLLAKDDEIQDPSILEQLR